MAKKKKKLLCRSFSFSSSSIKLYEHEMFCLLKDKVQGVLNLSILYEANVMRVSRKPVQKQKRLVRPH